MKKTNMLKKVLISLLLVIFIGITTLYIKADSGWDTDYDSGWSSSSDWGSSSSWTSSSSGGSWVTLLIVIGIIIVVIVENKVNEKNKDVAYQQQKIYPSVPEEEIRKYISDFNKELFLNNAYDIFVNIQNAWTNFDYDSLRKYLSDELFNTYKSQLRVLNAKKQKNMMHDFVRYNMDITSINNIDNKTALTVELIVSFYDYVVDKDNNVVRGTSSRKITNHYELTFICSKNTNKKANKCPNCNAPLENIASNVCPYCNSNIVSEHYDWILSKKEIKK